MLLFDEALHSDLQGKQWTCRYFDSRNQSTCFHSAWADLLPQLPAIEYWSMPMKLTEVINFKVLNRCILLLLRVGPEEGGAKPWQTVYSSHLSHKKQQATRQNCTSTEESQPTMSGVWNQRNKTWSLQRCFKLTPVNPARWKLCWGLQESFLLTLG